MVFFNQSNYIHYLLLFYNSISIFFFILLKSLSFHLFLRQEKQKQHFIECFLSFSSLKLSNKVHIPNTKWVLIFRLRLKVICNLFYFLNYLLDFSHKYLPCLHAWQQCKKFTYPIWTTVFSNAFCLVCMSSQLEF